MTRADSDWQQGVARRRRRVGVRLTVGVEICLRIDFSSSSLAQIIRQAGKRQCVCVCTCVCVVCLISGRPHCQYTRTTHTLWLWGLSFSSNNNSTNSNSSNSMNNNNNNLQHHLHNNNKKNSSVAYNNIKATRRLAKQGKGKKYGERKREEREREVSDRLRGG